MGFKIAYLQNKNNGESKEGDSIIKEYLTKESKIEREKCLLNNQKCISDSGIDSIEEPQQLDDEQGLEQENNIPQVQNIIGDIHEKKDNPETKSIEKQVIEEYENEINKLDVRLTLKSYLKRTLNRIVYSNDTDKVFLLEIRKQLKVSSKTTSKQQYSDFLKLVDKLFLLAVDKSISCKDSNNYNNTLTHDENRGRISNNLHRLYDSINGSTSTENLVFIRELQRNALSRLASALRNRETINNNIANQRYSQDEQMSSELMRNVLREVQQRHNYFGMRNISSQVVANEGDTSIQNSSSETASNLSAN